jgi:AcrR family transcriptional regulator
VPATLGGTRARILAAAAELVGERGWDAVTTRAIAERASVNQALVHYYFGSMDVVLREAVLAAMRSELGAALAPLMAGVPLGDGLRGLGRELGTLDPSSPRAMLFVEAILRTARDPLVREAMADELRAARALLAERIASEVGAGVVRPDVSPPDLAALITAALDGLLLHRIADGSTSVPGAVEALLGSLTAPAAPLRDD